MVVPLPKLPDDVAAESTPYNPQVPEGIRDVSPDLHEFLQGLTDQLRQAHQKSQVGSPTVNWSQMQALDSTPRYALGSAGSFYNATYGVFSGVYVRFDKMLAKQVGGPVTVFDSQWGVTNDWSQSASEFILGVLAAPVVPANDMYGWVLTKGVNLYSLELTGAAPARNDYLTWETDGTLRVDGTSLQLVGRVTSDSDVSPDGVLWVIGAGSIAIDCSGSGSVSGFSLSRIKGEVTTTPLDYGDQIVEINQRLDLIDGQNDLSISLLSQRISKLDSNNASIQLTQKISAAANFANVAGTAAGNALQAMGIVNVKLGAVSAFTQMAQSYRDDAGFYSESALGFSTAASLSANNGAVSADASASHALDSQTSATAAGVSAQASETSRLAAAVQADNAATSATNANTYQVNASQSAAAALSSSNLAAQYAQQTANGNNTGFQQVNASIAAESQARASADGALTTDYVNRDSQVLTGAKGYTDANITTVNQTIAGVNQSIAQQSTTLTAAYQAADSGLYNTVTAHADSAAAGALSNANSHTDAVAAGINSTITQNAQAAASATAANTSLITQQRSDFNGLSATVSQQSGTLVDIQGKQHAFFQITATAGGTAYLQISADQGGGAINLGGNLTLDGNLTLTGTHRITLNTGTVMRVQGLGFGTSNQFLSWFGPTMDPSQCSESNAISYEKLNGSAYFGGTLNAGIITNAVQTTTTTTTPSITTGSFGSNGHTRNVTVSFNYVGHQQITTACPANPGNPSVTVYLYRGTDATGALLSSQTFTGSYSCSPGFGSSEPGSTDEGISGSFTFADNAGGTSAAYYATASRTSHVPVYSQSLGIVSVEQ